MQTLYIDVYFLINFTVNILALYFSALFSKIKSTLVRLLICACIGSLSACIIVLLDFKGIFFALTLLMSAALIVYIFCVKTSLVKQIKFFAAFMLFEALIGGLVNFAYTLLDKYLYPKLIPEEFGAENRSILLLALMILFSFGVVKLMFYIFRGIGAERSTSVKIFFYEDEISATALIDSGNLVTDPISSRPVVFVKSEVLRPLIKKYGNLSVSNDPRIKTRFRVIPVKTIGAERVLIGLRCDKLFLGNCNRVTEDIVIALDEDDGTYGGHKVLVPLTIAEEMC